MTSRPPGEPGPYRALLRVAGALPPLERAYAVGRFLIMRARLLAVMDRMLPPAGRVLDVGCGFGLFTSYFAQVQPGRRITGVDRSSSRVATARRVAARLGISAEFIEGDIRTAPISGLFDAAYVLDVLHHIPERDQRSVLLRLRGLLAPGGSLVIKDITTQPRAGLLFTHALDRLMVGWSEPLAYRHHDDWRQLLEGLGFRVQVVRVPDVLPYPHVVLSATLATA
jgi:2-polyprenyl-3-methyl-5-hydroxy-6-metoxy-1,4-benzoquinol methylase